ncbi:TLD domain containing protein, partial [Amanita muscaria]
SPFASHMSVPISGAPGFVDERYNWDRGFSDDELIEKKLGSVELKGRKEITVPVLDVMLADSLRTHLPALDRLPKTWSLVYSLDQHGISLNTLYTRCEAHTQAQAQSQARLGRDSVFGVWSGDGLRQSRGKGYYGSGESFMWRYRNVEKDLDVYKWTGKISCLANRITFLLVVGEEGKYGLYLDETLFEGSSARCPTFDNEPLCSPGANKAGAVAFECVGLEVWGIGP